MDRKTLLERFGEFAKKLANEDRIAVVYHPDADGLCSALIASKAVEKIRGRLPEMVFSQPPSQIAISPATVRKLRADKISKLIAVDLCVDQEPGQIMKVEKFAELLVVDHHKVYRDLNSRQTLFIKAQFVSKSEGSAYPASKLCFDLFSKVISLDEVEWAAAVGVIGDKGRKRWRKFILKAVKASGISAKKLEMLSGIIEAVAAASPKKIDQLFAAFCKAQKPQELLKSRFARKAEKIENELGKLLKKFEREKEVYPEIELVYFAFKSSYNIKSALINRISNDIYPDRTVVVVADSRNRKMRASARRQDFRVKVNELLERTVKGLSRASAGGHIPAAAACFRKKDLKKFRGNLLRVLKESRGGRTL